MKTDKLVAVIGLNLKDHGLARKDLVHSTMSIDIGLLIMSLHVFCMGFY